MRYKILLILAMATVLFIPALVQAVTFDSTLTLDNKDTTTWERISDGRLGTLNYNSSGPTFNFSFSATGMENGVAYSLIYYANPYPGNNPGALIGTGTADSSGNVAISGSPNLNMNLPTPPDSNMITDHTAPPDNYYNAHGAKIWLVPSVCYDSTLKKIITWSPTRFLFETDVITYTDTDLGGGSVVSTTTTITEPVATIGMTVTPVTLSFGSVQIGSDSAEQTITLTNTGNVPIKATATTSSGFYTDCLSLKPSGGTYSSGSGWVSPTIPASGSLTVYAKVHPTIAYSGTVTGTLTFVASFAP